MDVIQGQPAGIYLRISDDREGKRLGVKRQEKDSLSLAAQLGVKLRDTYCDNDISAGPTSRKPRDNYDRLLQDARDGRIEVILAYSTSRLTRRPREHEDLIDLAVTYGIRFYFVASPAYDLNTADGREAARMAAARDTGEVERLQERMLRKKLEDAEEGKYPGGPRTYCLGKVIGINPADRKEVRDWTTLVDEEVAVVRDWVDRLLSGDSQMSIAKSSNEHGITMPKGGAVTVGKIKRTVLYESYVTFDAASHPANCPCLLNPPTGGTRVHGDSRHRAQWPGFITQAEHAALQSYFANNPHNWQAGQIVARRYLLSGFTVCGRCGGAVYGQGKTENGRYIRRYHCKKYNNRGEQVGCSTVFRIADPVEELVQDAVLLRFDSPDVAEALAPTNNKGRARELTQEIAQLQQRRLDLAAEHAITRYEDYSVMLTAIKAKMDRAQTELTQLRTEDAKRALVPVDGTLRTMFDTASIEWQASVIKLLVKRVIIHPSSPGGMLWRGRRFNPNDVEIEWLA